MSKLDYYYIVWIKVADGKETLYPSELMCRLVFVFAHLHSVHLQYNPSNLIILFRLLLFCLLFSFELFRFDLHK